MPRVFSMLLVGGFLLGIWGSLTAEGGLDSWQAVAVPGPIPVGAGESVSPWRAYRAWFKPHDSFFTPHERNLFAESVAFHLR